MCDPLIRLIFGWLNHSKFIYISIYRHYIYMYIFNFHSLADLMVSGIRISPIVKYPTNLLFSLFITIFNIT